MDGVREELLLVLTVDLLTARSPGLWQRREREREGGREGGGGGGAAV